MNILNETTTLLENALSTHNDKLVLASSLGVEDQVLTHLLCSLTDNPQIFVLDTGRLHQETYDVLEQTQNRYGFTYNIYTPDTAALENMLKTHGPNLFYHSVEKRKLCCQIRKVDPLKRALAGASAWITGQRKAQSVTRAELALEENDTVFGLIKYNPLANWSTEAVWAYAIENKLPVNALHQQGYPSIGCAPCTRPVKPGEDLRAGRWWWEDVAGKECGLHSRRESLDKGKEIV